MSLRKTLSDLSQGVLLDKQTRVQISNPTQAIEFHGQNKDILIKGGPTDSVLETGRDR